MRKRLKRNYGPHILDYKEVCDCVLNKDFHFKLMMVEKCLTNVFGFRKSMCVWVVVILLCGSPLVLAQPGFLSIACGAKRNYTDGNGITWVPDAKYINAGSTAQTPNASTLPFELQNFRFFPYPLHKSCYQLPIIPHARYLLRLTSFSGNYSRIRNTQSCYASLVAKGAFYTIEFDLANAGVKTKEIEFIFTSSSHVMHICLTPVLSGQDPFISAIELRRLSHGMYNMVKQGIILVMNGRFDLGGSSSTRYPRDPYDRKWFPISASIYNRSDISNIATIAPISDEMTDDFPPSAVMETALFTNTTRLGLNFSNNLDKSDVHASLLFFYFAEIQRINASHSRIFNVTINGMDISSGLNVLKRTNGSYSTSIEIQYKLTDSKNFKIELIKTDDSTFGPIINALEHYVIYPTELETLAEDVNALSGIKSAFGLTNWISDPCYVVQWEGVTCSDPQSSPVRVLDINLSGRNFNSSIPSGFGLLTALKSLSLDHNHLNGFLPNLSNLTHLESLHLENNNLSGRIPKWLSGLQNLKLLNLTNNSFSGDIPPELLRLKKNFSFDGNPLLIFPKQTNSSVNPLLNFQRKGLSSEKRRLVIGLTIGSFIAIALAWILITEYRKQFSKKTKMTGGGHGSSTKSNMKSFGGEDYSVVEVPNPTKSRAFTLDEMMTATKNFTQIIGKGGFGSVHYGKFCDGKEVAVKVLSLFSKQGVQEFLNEVDLLSRVHHKNLVTLLGYCNESRELMLIYEYMSGGTLRDHLHGSEADLVKLDWKTRLQIALDAAQGLEYLHVKCTPKVIHRDVKTANILLDKDLSGKLSDFGLSRTTMDAGDSHVTTTVKGTAGYLDPEYFSTHMLTEKSDVYSFGVVLLEIVCGRQPIIVHLPEEEINLIRWATPYLEDEDPNRLLEIVDKRLVCNYDIKSVSIVSKLAIRCVQPEPASRPTITQIVTEIKDALELQKKALIPVSEEIQIQFGELPSSTSAESSYVKETDSTDNSSHAPKEER